MWTIGDCGLGLMKRMDAMRGLRDWLITIALVLGATNVSAQQPPRPPVGPSGTVTLPLPDYDALVERATRAARPPEPPPIPAVLSRAQLDVRIAADRARGTFRLDGEVFRSGSTLVPLVSGATLLDAQIAGRPLPLLQKGDAHVAILTGPGAFSATLDWGAPIVQSPGRGSCVLPAVPAGSVHATIDLPGEQTDVNVAPGLITRRAAANGRTVIDATLEPGRPVQVVWSARDTAPPPPARETRTLADVRTLVTIGDADVRMVALLDVTVVQGEPRTFEVRLPEGFELARASGSTLDTSDERAGALVLTVLDPAVRRHQFLVSLERPHAAGSFKLETRVAAVAGTQRETGEIAIEGIGTMELEPAETDGLRRVDVREISAALRSLARQPVLAALRYHRRAEESPLVTVDVKRFDDAAVLAAVTERAVATTLVTTEGRALTEVSLWIRNRAQPFLRVVLPEGASMLSVDVGGEAAKHSQGADGTRVPLLRTGFRPQGAYQVSFVYLHAGEAFQKRGRLQMALPRIDIPVGMLEWELFLPDGYTVKRIGGNVLAAELVEQAALGSISVDTGASGQLAAADGLLIGRVTDDSGAPVPGAAIVVEGRGSARRTTVADQSGSFVVMDVPAGPVTVTAQLAGFRSVRRTLIYDRRPRRVDFSLTVGALAETVTVTAEAPLVQGLDKASQMAQAAPGAQQQPSANVLNLQRRVAGVLPVRVDVPRAGTLHRFVRPLVLDEETMVSFQYKRR
jgi:hypothetical protein